MHEANVQNSALPYSSVMQSFVHPQLKIKIVQNWSFWGMNYFVSRTWLPEALSSRKFPLLEFLKYDNTANAVTTKITSII